LKAINRTFAAGTAVGPAPAGCGDGISPAVAPIAAIAAVTTVAAIAAAVANATVTAVTNANATVANATIANANATVTNAPIAAIAAVTGINTARGYASFERKQYILLSCVTASPGQNRNVSLAEAGRNDQVDLIKTGARQPHVERRYYDVVNVKRERAGNRRGA
jgi:hypothetical protein